MVSMPFFAMKIVIIKLGRFSLTNYDHVSQYGGDWYLIMVKVRGIRIKSLKRIMKKSASSMFGRVSLKYD